MKLPSLHLLAAVLLFASSNALAALSIPKVVVALKPDKDPEVMMEERRALTAFLTEKLGCPVEIIIPLNSAVIIEGLANGTIDFGYLSATDMINARKAKAADLLLAGEINGKPSYTSYWVTLKDKPYTRIADLKGKPIAFASKTSTSGFVIPMWDLHEKGLLARPAPETFFGEGNVFFGTGYVSAIERVLNGQAEAAAVSYYVLDQDKHLSVEQRGRLKKFAEQGPVPTHVIAARSSLSAADRDALKVALDALNTPEHAALRDRLFTSKLIPVDAGTHLRSLDAAIQFLSAKK